MLKDFDLPRRGRSTRGGGRSVDCLVISSLGSGDQPSTDAVTDVVVVALGNKFVAAKLAPPGWTAIAVRLGSSSRGLAAFGVPLHRPGPDSGRRHLSESDLIRLRGRNDGSLDNRALWPAVRKRWYRQCHYAGLIAIGDGTLRKDLSRLLKAGAR